MSEIAPSAGSPLLLTFGERWFGKAMRSVGPPLLFGLRLWASVCLALYVAFWLQLDNPFWAGTSAAIVCQPQLGASLRKGWFRMIGTLIGAVMSVVLTACFPQDRVLFLGALTLWGAGCALVATVLRNFAAYSAALAGYSVAIIGGDLLGATGGVDANAAFLLAVARASEIIIGITCAGIVLAGTDLGGAPRRLAGLLANLTAEITRRFIGTLAAAGPALPDLQAERRELLRQVVALDPVIDQTFGESSRLRYHSPILQSAVDGLVIAVAGWRAVANILGYLPDDAAQQQARAVLTDMGQELQVVPEPAAWTADPAELHRRCIAAAQRLRELPATVVSLRLLADQAARALIGIADAANGLALLVADPARPIQRSGGLHLRVPDWLPAFVNAGRAFVVIGAVALFWIVSAWPGGSETITFAAIVVLLLGPRADEAYGAALLLTVGATVALVFAAIIKFAVLPGLGTETFVGLSLALGSYLVPMAILFARARRPWQVGLFTGATFLFMPLLAPTNPMSYDPLTYYNTGLTIVIGCGVGALSFRVLPPLRPAYRTRRLLTLGLRDLRRLAIGRFRGDWFDLMRNRLVVMPPAATPLQLAQLLAAFTAGRQIIQLRPFARQLNLDAALNRALSALARRNSAAAIAHLNDLDATLAAHDEQPDVLHGRGSILAFTELLAQHAAYFDAEIVR